MLAHIFICKYDRKPFSLLRRMQTDTYVFSVFAVLASICMRTYALFKRVQALSYAQTYYLNACAKSHMCLRPFFNACIYRRMRIRYFVFFQRNDVCKNMQTSQKSIIFSENAPYYHRIVRFGAAHLPTIAS